MKKKKTQPEIKGNSKKVIWHFNYKQTVTKRVVKSQKILGRGSSTFHLYPQTFKHTFSRAPYCLVQYNSQPRHATALSALYLTNLPFRHAVPLFHLPWWRKLNFLTSVAAVCFLALASQTGILYQMIYNKHLPGSPSVKLQVIFFPVSCMRAWRLL